MSCGCKPCLEGRPLACRHTSPMQVPEQGAGAGSSSIFHAGAFKLPSPSPHYCPHWKCLMHGMKVAVIYSWPKAAPRSDSRAHNLIAIIFENLTLNPQYPLNSAENRRSESMASFNASSSPNLLCRLCRHEQGRITNP